MTTVTLSSTLADIRADLARHGVSGWMGTLKALAFNLPFQVVLSYRLHRYFATRSFWRMSLLQILISRWQVTSGNCQISPRAEIAGGLLLPHPLGVVVGIGCKVGRDVTLYQGVTLGADAAGGYPELGDEVVVYAQSCVVGSIHLGQGSTLGALSFLSQSLPPRSVAAGSPARILRTS
jgi:serine O-acetyltransferase